MLAIELFRKIVKNRPSGSFHRLLSCESGSASVEFVLLAIPLFLPILLFLNHFEQLSNSELVARTLVRESLRAYVTSPNPSVAPVRANQTLVAAAKVQGLSAAQIDSIDLTFQCSETPCLSPGGRVRATLKMRIPGSQDREVISQAEEYISPWQWNQTARWFRPSFEINWGWLDLKFGN